MNEIKQTLKSNKKVPFILTKVTDTSYSETPIYFLSLESDIDKTSVDICGVVENFESKEAMEVAVEEITKEYELEIQESTYTM